MAILDRVEKLAAQLRMSDKAFSERVEKLAAQLTLDEKVRHIHVLIEGRAGWAILTPTHRSACSPVRISGKVTTLIAGHGSLTDKTAQGDCPNPTLGYPISEGFRWTKRSKVASRFHSWS
jgi:hypothetical protein